MKESTPLVSVIAMCYNHSRFVVECLESIRLQTYKNTELIIMDDCSEDNSVEIIKAWIEENGVRCVFIPHTENKGICKTLNEALSHARGKYVMTISTDDVCLPDRLESHVRQIEASPEEVGLLYSDALQIDEGGQPLPETIRQAWPVLTNPPEGDVFQKLLERNFIPAPTVLVRKAAYDRVGLYDESLCYEDWDMWLRMARHYKFIFSPTVSVKYRIVSTSHTRSVLETESREKLVSDITLRSKYLPLKGVGETQKRLLREFVTRDAEMMYKLGYGGRGSYLWKALKFDPRPRTFGMFAFSACAAPYDAFHNVSRRFDNLRRKLKDLRSGAARTSPADNE
ncbi:MAG: glycosyltransferase [Acidobacteriota bacterium]|nr:glycosyltransferase [Acidobacteriota bacterium]